jgi:hypothetical protein
MNRYSEAIEILYKENIFEFDSLNDVLKLSLTLIPERMHLIKKVQWKWVFNFSHNDPFLIVSHCSP